MDRPRPNPVSTVIIGRPRGVAQSGSAPGWGPGGRRFKSCLPDQGLDGAEGSNVLHLFGVFPCKSSNILLYGGPRFPEACDGILKGQARD
jgi:hypothetical protein